MYSVSRLNPLRVIASNENKENAFAKKVASRRKHYEDVRNLNLRRVKEDIKHIANRELEYTKNFLDSIFPVKVHVNEQALKDLQEKSPVKIEVNWGDDQVSYVDPEVVEEGHQASEPEELSQ